VANEDSVPGTYGKNTGTVDVPFPREPLVLKNLFGNQRGGYEPGPYSSSKIFTMRNP
jgi:hypothetical protein